jgi:hypothetical protein|uniref:Uncharacterized protein n=1 Tax=viral metagenome TaxID=1070528 RepID=A0A6C0IX27_9ZZZZ
MGDNDDDSNIWDELNVFQQNETRIIVDAIKQAQILHLSEVRFRGNLSDRAVKQLLRRKFYVHIRKSDKYGIESIITFPLAPISITVEKTKKELADSIQPQYTKLETDYENWS